MKLKDGMVSYGFIVYEDAKTIRVELDEPWNPGVVKSFSKSRVKEFSEVEYSGHRITRIEEGWLQLGCVKVGELAVEKAEADAARSAREMVAAADKAAAPPPPPPSPPPPPPPPGLLRQWRPHAGLLFVAAALIGIITKTLLLGK